MAINPLIALQNQRATPNIQPALNQMVAGIRRGPALQERKTNMQANRLAQAEGGGQEQIARIGNRARFAEQLMPALQSGNQQQAQQIIQQFERMDPQAARDASQMLQRDPQGLMKLGQQYIDVNKRIQPQGANKFARTLGTEDIVDPGPDGNFGTEDDFIRKVGVQSIGPGQYRTTDIGRAPKETPAGKLRQFEAEENIKTQEQLYRQAIKEGKMLIPDGQGGMEMVAIPGSEAAGEQQTKARSSAKTSGFIMRDLGIANELLEQSSDNPYVRLGKSKVLGTPEYELAQQIKSLQGTIGIESLLDIKREGAGLGQVPQTQLDLLSRLLGQLSIDRDKDITQTLLDDTGLLYASTLSRMSPEDRRLAGIADREFNQFMGEFRNKYGEKDYRQAAQRYGIQIAPPPKGQGAQPQGGQSQGSGQGEIQLSPEEEELINSVLGQ